MNKVAVFFNKPFIKSLVLGVLTLLIGGECSALGTWDFTTDTYIKMKIAFLIVTSIVYIIALAFYSVYDINLNKVVRIYKSQNDAFAELMSGLMASCKQSAEGANDIIHMMIDEGKVDLKLWNFDKACQWICEYVYSLLCKLGNGDDFEVIYDRLVENGEKPEKYIYTNAYANKNKRKPTVYQEMREFLNDEYHDCELFRDKVSDLEIIIGTDEIDKVFIHRSKQKRNKNKDKYSQYIAIPVFCNDEKMVGLFEITCFHQTHLGSNAKEIEDVVSRYLIPYSFLILLLHKLEKSLLAQPKLKED